MLSKNELKLISSLKSKKQREKHRLFIVEGAKCIKEFLDSSFKLKTVYAIEDILNIQTIEINQKELEKISQLRTPNKALALFKMAQPTKIDDSGLIVALDSVRDPGNLGTIIRLCDWFGIKDLICSDDTVDHYNPKVVQSSMGSLTRVNITYLNLEEYLDNTTSKIYGTTMTAASVYNTELNDRAILVLGNEANGISEIIKSKISEFISIPRFNMQSKVESLNVATATAILLNEFRR